MAAERIYMAWPKWVGPARTFSSPSPPKGVGPVVEGDGEALALELGEYIASKDSQKRLSDGQKLRIDIAAAEWNGKKRSRPGPIKTADDLVERIVGMRLAPTIWFRGRSHVQPDPSDRTLPMAVWGGWTWPEGGSDAFYDHMEYWPMPVSVFQVMIEDLDNAGAAHEALFEEGAILNLEIASVDPEHPDQDVREAIREWSGTGPT